MSPKQAIVLFNFGAPESTNEIQNYQYRLFSDNEVIKMPFPLNIQKIIAYIISRIRYKKVVKKYNKIGGKSPLMEISRHQKRLLEDALNDNSIRVFLAMKYSKPFIADCLEEISKFNISKIIFIPLFPHYSFVTTKSFYLELKRHLKIYNFQTYFVKDYYKHPLFIKAWVEEIKLSLESIKNKEFTLLFSAHSIPQKYVQQGDPYPQQINTCAKLIFKKLSIDAPMIISYQSRVGPIKWLEPETEKVLKELAKTKKNVIFIPISFVSDNLETLYDGKIFKEFFKNQGGKEFIQVSPLNTTKCYIECLKDISSINKSFLYSSI